MVTLVTWVFVVHPTLYCAAGFTESYFQSTVIKRLHQCMPKRKILEILYISTCSWCLKQHNYKMNITQQPFHPQSYSIKPCILRNPSIIPAAKDNHNYSTFQIIINIRCSEFSMWAMPISDSSHTLISLQPTLLHLIQILAENAELQTVKQSSLMQYVHRKTFHISLTTGIRTFNKKFSQK